MKVFFSLALLSAAIIAQTFKNPYVASVTHIFAIDFRINGFDAPSPVLVGLFGNDVPLTVANFAAICDAELPNKPAAMNFKNTIVHRIIPQFVMQGGDFTDGNGTGGYSIYGRYFNDERLDFNHDIGVLSMANSGPNTNGSQFFITLKPQAHLNGKYVVFGRVLDGWSTVVTIESFGSSSGTPTAEIRIERCYKVGQVRPKP